MGASEYVRAALLDVLPDGVPPSFSSIDKAYWSGTGARRIATAHLTMFDGEIAVVEVRQAGVCTSHRFTEMPGGACSFERGAWVRVSEPTQ